MLSLALLVSLTTASQVTTPKGAVDDAPKEETFVDDSAPLSAGASNSAG